MTAYSLFIVCLFSLARAQFNCATPQVFTDSNKKLYSERFLAFEEHYGMDLHTFLYEEGTKIGSGGYGIVKSAAGFPNIVIKKMTFETFKDKRMARKEIDVLTLVCGRNILLTYNELLECQSNAIAGFKGCVEDGNTIYIFQDRVHNEFSNLQIKQTYRNLPGKRKAKIMISLINKYQEIHDKNLIHNDIKPGNIMVTDGEISDVRIVDFGLSDRPGQLNYGGTPIYIDPYRFIDRRLTVEGDIYSLAITFTMLEEKGELKMRAINKDCFDRYPSDKCITKIKNAIKHSFNSETRTDLLLDAILKATDVDINRRYHSMRDFADDISRAAEGLDNENKLFIKQKYENLTNNNQFIIENSNENIDLRSDSLIPNNENSNSVINSEEEIKIKVEAKKDNQVKYMVESDSGEKQSDLELRKNLII